MLIRILSLTAFLALSAGPVAAAPPAPIKVAKAISAEGLMHAAGLDRVFDDYSEIVADTPEPYESIPVAILAAWKETAVEVLAADPLYREFVPGVYCRLSTPELTELAAFFHSDLGMRITEMEIAASQLSVEQIDEGVTILDALAPDSTRSRQIGEIVGGADTDFGRSLMAQYWRARLVSEAISQTTGDIDLPWDEIDAQFAQTLPAVEARVLTGQRAVSAYIYRELRDEELETYVEFLRTKASQRFDTLVEHSLGTITERSISQFYERLAARLKLIDL